MAVDLVYPDHVGGSHRFYYEVGRRLARRGHEVHVATGRERPEDPPVDNVAGMHVHRFPRERRSPLFQALSYLSGSAGVYRPLARESPFDIISGHYPLATAGVLLAGGWKRPLVYSLYGPWADEYGVELGRKMESGSGWTARVARCVSMGGMRWLEGACLHRARRVHVLSQYTAGQAASIHGVPPDRISIIPAGVDSERFSPGSKVEARRRLALDEGGPVLLTVRRLYARMGLENLLDAMPLIARQLPDSRLLIAGKGPLPASLEERIARLGLQERVSLLGFVSDDLLPDYYRAADLFVLPTVALEGFGLVTLEAMACGTPVVGTPVGATSELLGAFDGRMLAAGVAPGDIASAVLWLLGRREDLARLGERARQFALRYSWDDTAERLEALFQSVGGAADGS